MGTVADRWGRRYRPGRKDGLRGGVWTLRPQAVGIADDGRGEHDDRVDGRPSIGAGRAVDDLEGSVSTTDESANRRAYGHG